MRPAAALLSQVGMLPWHHSDPSGRLYLNVAWACNTSVKRREAVNFMVIRLLTQFCGRPSGLMNVCDGSSRDSPPPTEHMCTQFQCEHVLNIRKTFSLNAVTLEQRVLWWLPEDQVGHLLNSLLMNICDCGLLAAVRTSCGCIVIEVCVLVFPLTFFSFSFSVATDSGCQPSSTTRATSAPGGSEEVRATAIPTARKWSRGSPRVFATARLLKWTPQHPQARTSKGGLSVTTMIFLQTP